MLQDWTGSKLNLVLTGGKLGEIDRFSSFVSCISPVGRIPEELSSRIKKALLALTSEICGFGLISIYLSKAKYAQ